MTTAVGPRPHPAAGTSGRGQPAAADVFVIFGITGDLAKVMTFHSLYRLERRGLLRCPILGVAVSDWSVEDPRDHARASIEGCGERIDDEVFDRFAARLAYVSGDFSDRWTFQQVARAVGDARSPVFYLEIPPLLFGRVIKGLTDAGLTKTSRVVVEKPFDHDLASARELAEEIHQYIDESQLYRIDHFLGKMGLGEILYLRLANAILEPMWNRRYVSAVEMGALRDVVVNHLMQVVAATAMEPPAARDAQTLKDAMVGLYRTIAEAHVDHYVRGQYGGYRSIDGVAPDSTTETYAALRLEVDNWRWSGVPFFIRTGKCLAATQTEVRLVFEGLPPRLGFGLSRRPEPDQLVVRLDPTTGIRVLLEAQRADHVEPEQINLDMEFAAEGGEGPTPYEVLLHAALIGNSKRFTRQDSVEECWRNHATAARRPSAHLSIRQGNLGPSGGRSATRRPRGLARTLGGVMSTSAKTNRRTRKSADGQPTGASQAHGATIAQSAAAPSPFTPIADYAFLSNCHTGALVAPDGTIDWLCVPRFDSASAFGSLLDRGAGSFRFGPFGVNVPSDRVYEPGTNSLITSWKTPTGWAIVRDALTMGPRRGEDVITPHTRPPADEDAEHMLVRTARCLGGSVEIDLVCEPAFDYGRAPAEWSLADDRHRADASGAGESIQLQTDMLIGIEAGRARARHVLREGEAVYCALAWDEQVSAPATVEEAFRHLDTTTRFWRGWLQRARIPDHHLGPLIQRSALAIKGLTYMPTGATVAALTTSLPETPGGERNWDYRYTWIRDSTFTLQALHYLNLDWEADEFMQFVADLVGLRRRAAGADRQRRVRSAPERRVRRRARLDLPAHAAQPAPAAAAVAAGSVPGRMRQGRVAQTRSRDLGGSRQAAALRLVEADVLGRARPGGEAGRDPWRAQPRRQLGRDRGGNRGDLRLPPATRRGAPRERAGDRGRVDRERVRPAGPTRPTTACPARRGRS